MSTMAGNSPVHAAWSGRILVVPKKSVVSPLGTSAFEPASIVGLDAVSWTSKETGTPLSARSGLAQMFPAPASGSLVLPRAQMSGKAGRHRSARFAEAFGLVAGESSATIEFGQFQLIKGFPFDSRAIRRRVQGDGRVEHAQVAAADPHAPAAEIKFWCPARSRCPSTTASSSVLSGSAALLQFSAWMPRPAPQLHENTEPLVLLVPAMSLREKRSPMLSRLAYSSHSPPPP